MNLKIFFFAVLTLLFSVGVTSTIAQTADNPSADSAEKAPPVAADQVPSGKPANPTNKASGLEYTGKILLLPGEDNAYGIESDNGDKYVPVNLPELLKEEGLWVHLKAEKVKEKQNKPGWGEYIRILNIAVDPCLTEEVQVE